MRRFLTTLLFTVALLGYSLPALAQAAPVHPDTNPTKARIDAYAKYVSDREVWKEVAIDPVRFPDILVTLHKGLFDYVEDWVGVFQAATSKDGLALSSYATGYSGSADTDRGEGVNGFYNYCGKYKDFVLKAQALAERAVSASTSKFATADQQTKISEILRAIAATTMNSMAVTLVQSGNVAIHGNAVCAKAIGDIYYSFENPPSQTTYACTANVLSDPGKEPTNSSGGCTYRNRNSLGIATMKDCVHGDGCTAKVVTNCEASNDPRCVWYDFKSTRAKMDANLAAYEALLADQDKKLVEIGVELLKSGTDAAKLSMDLQARGTALSLPLPLSDVTVEGVIGRVLNAILGIVGAVALLMFVWGGVTWMTAAGSQDKVAKAKTTITWAAIGLIAIFSSYAILNLLISTFSK